MEKRVWVPTKLPIWITFHYTPKVMHSPSALGGKAREKEMHNRKDVIAKHLDSLLIHNPQRNSEADKTAFLFWIRHRNGCGTTCFPSSTPFRGARLDSSTQGRSAEASVLVPVPAGSKQAAIGPIQHGFPGS